MEPIYPPGPLAIPDNLTKPTAAYKRHAWLAVGGLALFVACYLLLAGWFVWTAYRIMVEAFARDGGLRAFVAGACAAFLAVFMLKALFFVKHGGTPDDLEITAAQQPRLFAFLHRLADEAGAPRPHRVFLSPQVNAAVFYDLTLVNLIYPSKKNLEIGLGLVNVLSLGELKAVFAHEFGHFAQRTMAVGRWVYIAQQIAAHIIARRDALDVFLSKLSRFDLRVAWIGWLLSLIVWAIRSLLETAFSLVILAQRALSREMEMQADLVAVSLTGSDALVHALHRLQAADEAWAVALGFAGSELGKKRAVQDVFAIQSRVIEHIAAIRNTPDYGQTPHLPAERPEGHRVFKAELAAPPRMWSSHPLNHEREENAKRVYIAAPAAPINECSAWELFENPAELRARATSHLIGSSEAALDAVISPIEDSIRELDNQFDRESLNRRYRGVYLGRSVVHQVERAADLYGPSLEVSIADLDSLYPESLADDLEQLRNLEQEKAMLESLRDGLLAAPNGVIRHRGRELQPKELPGAIAAVAEEVAAVNAKVCDHDRRCRTVHRAAAASLGRGWEAHLVGLAEVLHFASHAEANIRDAQRALANAFAVETATGRASSAGVSRVHAAANDLHWALQQVFEQRHRVVLDETLAARMDVKNWEEALEEFKLERATTENLQSWLSVVDGWCESATAALSSLRSAALEQLLASEVRVARDFRAGGATEDAPAPASAPSQYNTLTPGEERQLQTKLGWWARFQNADGMIPAAARFAAALAIVGAVLGFGTSMGRADLRVYNGLARPVQIVIGEEIKGVAPHSIVDFSLTPDQPYKVVAQTVEGWVIESFDVVPEGKSVYNVASASPLVEWTAVYGGGSRRPDRMLGAPRWSATSADVLFTDPPDTLRTKGGGTSRDVLTGFGERAPGEQLAMLSSNSAGPAEQERLIAAHARWDDASSAHIVTWLGLASRLKDFPAIVEARLRDRPGEVVTLRAEQDVATGDARQAICNKSIERAAAQPEDANWHYLSCRCIADKARQEQAFLDGRRKWPRNGWLAYATGLIHAGRQRWLEASADLNFAQQHEPAIRDFATLELARIRRLLAGDGPVDFSDLTSASRKQPLDLLLAIERNAGLAYGSLRAYSELEKGRLDEAMKIARVNPAFEARMLRLVAASDGAMPEWINAALALPADRGLDAHTTWAALGLAIRQKSDQAPFVESLKQLEGEDSDALLRFAAALRNPAQAERALDGLRPEMRGKAYGLAVVVLGTDVPPKWRDRAKQLLFASERPYFK